MDNIRTRATDLAMSVTNICFIGGGYVGVLTATVMANKMKNIAFHIMDNDEDKIAAWKSLYSLPINEPNFRSMLVSVRDGTASRSSNLFFTNRFETVVETADIIFITLDTPLKSDGSSLCTEKIEDYVKRIADVTTSPKIIVIRSTVPCGKTDFLNNNLRKEPYSGGFPVIISNPEFMAAGTAMQNLLNPDRVVIGRAPDSLLAAETLQVMYEWWVPADRIMQMSNTSAELTKLASNALLAQRISSINSISMLCEETGADIDAVAKACGLDHRIGEHMLTPSLGFGGSCLPKDVSALAKLCDQFSLHDIGMYWRLINSVNDRSKSRFIKTIWQRMDNILGRKKITVLGCAFKKGVGDIRGSPGVALIVHFLKNGAHVAVYDGKVENKELLYALTCEHNLADLSKHRIEVRNSISDACYGASAIVIANDLIELSGSTSDGCNVTAVERVNWQEVAASLVQPKLLFDGCRVVDVPTLRRFGISVHRIGEKT